MPPRLVSIPGDASMPRARGGCSAQVCEGMNDGGSGRGRWLDGHREPCGRGWRLGPSERSEGYRAGKHDCSQKQAGAPREKAQTVPARSLEASLMARGDQEDPLSSLPPTGETGSGAEG